MKSETLFGVTQLLKYETVCKHADQEEPAEQRKASHQSA